MSDAMTTDRCPNCDKPVAGQREYDATPEGGGTGFCWDAYGTPCESYDWRAEALRLRAGVPDGVTRLGAETLATAPVPNPTDHDGHCLVCGESDCNERHAP